MFWGWGLDLFIKKQTQENNNKNNYNNNNNNDNNNDNNNNNNINNKKKAKETIVDMAVVGVGYVLYSRKELESMKCNKTWQERLKGNHPIPFS